MQRSTTSIHADRSDWRVCRRPPGVIRGGPQPSGVPRSCGCIHVWDSRFHFRLYGMETVPTEISSCSEFRRFNADSAPILLKASPVVYIKRDMPPFLLVHGSKDEDVPYAQSVEMCRKMKDAGARCDLITSKERRTVWIWSGSRVPLVQSRLWWMAQENLALRPPAHRDGWIGSSLPTLLLRKSICRNINPESDRADTLPSALATLSVCQVSL